jgi:hypothetical protein
MDLCGNFMKYDHLVVFIRHDSTESWFMHSIAIIRIS